MPNFATSWRLFTPYVWADRWTEQRIWFLSDQHHQHLTTTREHVLGYISIVTAQGTCLDVARTAGWSHWRVLVSSHQKSNTMHQEGESLAWINPFLRRYALNGKVKDLTPFEVRNHVFIQQDNDYTASISCPGTTVHHSSSQWIGFCSEWIPEMEQGEMWSDIINDPCNLLYFSYHV